MLSTDSSSAASNSASDCCAVRPSSSAREKLATMPWKVSGDDIAELRQAGYEDRAIHDTALVAAYFAFANRMADGLGVELEAGESAEPPAK